MPGRQYNQGQEYHVWIDVCYGVKWKYHINKEEDKLKKKQLHKKCDWYFCHIISIQIAMFNN
jgi:hypothetical protein